MIKPNNAGFSPEKVVVVGGPFDSAESLVGVSDTLAEFNPDSRVLAVPFLSAMSLDWVEKFRSDIEGAEVFVNSRGFLSLFGAEPASVTAFEPPLSRSAGFFAVSSLLTTIQLSQKEGFGVMVNDRVHGFAEFLGKFLGSNESRRLLSASLRSNSIATAHDLSYRGVKVDFVWGGAEGCQNPSTHETRYLEEYCGVTNIAVDGLNARSFTTDPEQTIVAIATAKLIHSLDVSEFA